MDKKWFPSKKEPEEKSRFWGLEPDAAAIDTLFELWIDKLLCPSHHNHLEISSDDDLEFDFTFSGSDTVTETGI